MVNEPARKEDLHRRRAVLRLFLGQAQVVGATVALVLLIQRGAVPAVFWCAGITGLLSLTSILLFRVIWRPKTRP